MSEDDDFPTNKKDWQKFAQKMADELGITVSVGYETKKINIARATPKRGKSALRASRKDNGNDR